MLDALLTLLSRRGTKMEAADDRMHLLHPRDLLRLPHRIDDADMTAGRDDDEPFAANVEASRVLVDVLIRYNFPLHLGRRVVAIVAARGLRRRIVH